MIDYNKYLHKINIERPLIFLCGPYFRQTDDDRRKILSDYIININTDEKLKGKITIKPIPIIVDEIFNNTKEINRLDLKLSMLEELVSIISCHTYILLDTMSSSMELGLFASSSLENKISILLPKKSTKNYNKRITIGEFIKESVNLKEDLLDVVRYEADIQLNPNKTDYYTYFPNNELPTDVKKHISDRMISIQASNIDQKIYFRDKRTNQAKFNEILYEVHSSKKINLCVSYKTLFYLVSTAINLNLYELDKINDISDEIIDNVINNLNVELLKSLIYGNSDLSLTQKIDYLVKKPQVSIQTSINEDIRVIIKHTIYLIKSIQGLRIHSSKGLKKVSGEEVFDKESIRSGYQFNRFDIEDFLRITKSDKKMIESYRENGEKYIKSYFCIIKGKKKKIVTYSDNKYGLNLRAFHKKLSERLMVLYEKPKISYAYNKNISIKDCLEIHKTGKSFYKTDIRHFFDSINISKLDHIIRIYFDKDPGAVSEYYFDFSGSTKRRVYMKPKLNCDSLKSILYACTYKRKIPIGFITSPVLSNLFLFFLDEAINNDNLNITRYADDLLISRHNDSNLGEMMMTIDKFKKGIRYLGLEENTSKIRYRSFKHNGDSIKYLGVNIVNTNGNNNHNSFTLGRKYIHDVCKQYCDYMKNPKQVDKRPIIGRMMYLKFIDEDIFKKYKKVFRIKTGIEFNEELAFRYS